MPRFARVVIPRCAHHITQRGNARRDTFFTPADRDVYLGLLKRYAQFHQVAVMGYCLMSNHVHLVLTPDTEVGLAKTLRVVHMRYAQYRNALEDSSGHIWQSRYYSCPIESHRLGDVMRYVELNPVRAGLVEDPRHYSWSSAKAHLRGVDVSGMLALTSWNRDWTPREWGKVLRSGQDRSEEIKEATYGGRPLGSEQFVEHLEKTLDRRLKRGLPGRPKRKERVLTA